MRAVASRDGQLRPVTLARPEPAAGQILIRVLACGICTSDLHFLKHGAAMVKASVESGGRFNLDLTQDVVMGHEFCGQVVARGPSTERTVAIGDRVTSIPPHGAFSNTHTGGYAEYMLLNAHQALPVPDEVPSEVAAMTEPMAVGRHAVAAARISAGEAAVVYGCGPIGLALVAHLKAAGAGTIVATDLAGSRRRLASAMGADLVLDPRTTTPLRALADRAGYRPGDGIVMFDAIGVRGSIAQLMREAPASGARIVVVGVCMQDDEIVPMAGIEKELQLKFVLAYSPAEFAATLDSICDGSIDPSPLISGRVGLDGIAAAFNELGDPESHCKIMVVP